MIKILGAGISGLAAAINLAKSGKEVAVYEKLKKIGDKIKPNYQLLGNWDISNTDILNYLKKLGIKVNYKNKLDRIAIYSPNLENIAEIYSSKARPVGYTVLRGGKGSFEQDLAKQAEREGVRILTNFKGNIKPDIIATGAKKSDGFAYGGIFEGDFDVKEAIVLFDCTYAPGGYAYILPHSKSVATIAIAFIKTQSIQKIFGKLYNHQLFGKYMRNAKLLYNFSGFANFSIPETAVVDGSLLVGEAAGFQDAAFGFGMRYAILSGFLAAKSITERRNYNSLWKELLLNDLKKTHRIRLVLNRAGNRFLNNWIKNVGKINIDEFSEKWLSQKKMAAVAFKSFLGI